MRDPVGNPGRWSSLDSRQTMASRAGHIEFGNDADAALSAHAR